jgi:hypothetical protein
MSTVDYGIYKIGTEGLEHGREGVSGFILEAFRQTYPLMPVWSVFGTLLFGGLNAAVPTYGLWAGPGMIFFVTSGVMTNSYCDTISAR